MAQVKVLIEGYTNADSMDTGGKEKTCATISLVQGQGINMVVDPGILESQQILVDALQKEGLEIGDINYVFLTHSHIDHYRNIGMFPLAKTIEFFGVWDGGTVDSWQEHFTRDIRIVKTPGHDLTGLTLFVRTDRGTVAICGDVFWKENYPEVDEYAIDNNGLEASRKMVLESADYIIPGHAGIFKVKK